MHQCARAVHRHDDDGNSSWPASQGVCGQFEQGPGRPSRRWRPSRSSSFCAEINQVPEAIRQAVINNGGGHANHTMFWEIMAPKAGGQPSGPLADDIKATFGDFATFQAQLKDAGVQAVSAAAGPGSCLPTASSKSSARANQDSPLMTGQIPAPGRRCLGACLLSQVPKQAPRLHRCLVERGQLDRRRGALQQGQVGQGVT